jgi:hypothetical membrane protein
MAGPHPNNRLIVATLASASAVPVLYCGAQLVAAWFYPGYSFPGHSASELGSDRSTFPAMLNVGAIMTGITTLFAGLCAHVAALRHRAARGLANVFGAAIDRAGSNPGYGSTGASIFQVPSRRTS